MINITDKSLCCGCTACVSVCPVQCIVMRREHEGFDYPFANPDRCIGCGKCDSVCPMMSEQTEDIPLLNKAWAARSDYESSSSSGGVFPLLAEKTINRGGIVFGAAFQSGLEVGHIEISEKSEISRLQGSKYVHSDLYSTFEDVKDYLNDGSEVLFSGTPCQIAGLKSYLSGILKTKDADLQQDTPSKGKLLTVDCACHGVPAPGLWENYLKALSKNFGSPVVSINFRDKTDGWREYTFTITLKDGRVIRRRKDQDPYMALFLQNMILRPSCYNCRFRSGNSLSDITLGDMWSIAKTVPEMNDGKGVSTVIARTKAGEAALSAIDLNLIEVPYDKAISANSGFQPTIQEPEEREAFFQKLAYAPNLEAYMKSFVKRKPLVKSIYSQVHTMLYKVKRSLKD